MRFLLFIFCFSICFSSHALKYKVWNGAYDAYYVEDKYSDGIVSVEEKEKIEASIDRLISSEETTAEKNVVLLFYIKDSIQEAIQILQEDLFPTICTVEQGSSKPGHGFFNFLVKKNRSDDSSRTRNRLAMIDNARRILTVGSTGCEVITDSVTKDRVNLFRYYEEFHLMSTHKLKELGDSLEEGEVSPSCEEDLTKYKELAADITYYLNWLRVLRAEIGLHLLVTGKENPSEIRGLVDYLAKSEFKSLFNFIDDIRRTYDSIKDIMYNFLTKLDGEDTAENSVGKIFDKIRAEITPVAVKEEGYDLEKELEEFSALDKARLEKEKASKKKEKKSKRQQAAEKRRVDELVAAAEQRRADELAAEQRRADELAAEQRRANELVKAQERKVIRERKQEYLQSLIEKKLSRRAHEENEKRIKREEKEAARLVRIAEETRLAKLAEDARLSREAEIARVEDEMREMLLEQAVHTLRLNAERKEKEQIFNAWNTLRSKARREHARTVLGVVSELGMDVAEEEVTAFRPSAVLSPMHRYTSYFSLSFPIQMSPIVTNPRERGVAPLFDARAPEFRPASSPQRY